ncbi:LPXTG cell wall anchor domain-containing protein [Alicyclobacillus sp. ALC3]|nr:LPXTG cell wall anchor domain-containing protein [Alicyclobacillus sp. ALC3]WDL99747.1 LPXTG cell wall anchor domain-containing protein [Alicyclobacillus sp. ALC3]
MSQGNAVASQLQTQSIHLNWFVIIGVLILIALIVFFIMKK